MQTGVIGQGLKKDIFNYSCINPRDFTDDNHKTVDDRPYGGGDGMIMKAEPLFKAINSSRQAGSKKVIYLSAQGRVWNDERARKYALSTHITLVCGRYGGIDDRLISTGVVDEEISIGDYILSGGELGALVVTDSLLRMLPGVLGHQESAQSDSHSIDKMGLLESPQYTRPEIWSDVGVPAVLISGHHEKINAWRKVSEWVVTAEKRPDLFNKAFLELSQNSNEMNQLKKQFKQLSAEEIHFFKSNYTDGFGSFIDLLKTNKGNHK